MNLETEPYLGQQARWPRSGRHILAQHDDQSVVVYQAFRPEIGHFAARHGRLGGGFSLGRMSWIKPNFLWMMHRCGWATKPDQEVVLAIRLSRSGFDEVLRRAVHSSFHPEVYGTEWAWKEAVARSDVRLQWDPDHGPSGQPLQRRAIQLGLRCKALSLYVEAWTLEIQDITEFVREQHANSASPFERLVIPREGVYRVEDAEVATKLGLSEWGGEPLAPA